MKELAAKSGFELVNVGVDQMDAFMKDKVKVYTEVAQAAWGWASSGAPYQAVCSLDSALRLYIAMSLRCTRFSSVSPS